MASAYQRRRFVSKHDREQFEAEKERLHSRIRELEAANDALGKAIGLLHQVNEHEPKAPERNEDSDS